MRDRNLYPNRASTPIGALGHLTTEELLREAQDSTDPLTLALAAHLARALEYLNETEAKSIRCEL